MEKPMRPMRIEEIQEMFLTGKPVIVEFNKIIEEYESCIDNGMKARIASISEPDEYQTVKISFDLSGFEEYNDLRMKANYYDKYGAAVLTAKEAGCWPKDGIESIWFDGGSRMVHFSVIQFGDTFL